MNNGFYWFFAVPHKTCLMVGYLHSNSSLFAAIMYGLITGRKLIVRRQKKVLCVLNLCFNGLIQCVVLMDSEARYHSIPESGLIYQGSDCL